MPRPKRRRRICRIPDHVSFSPDDAAGANRTEDAGEAAIKDPYAGMSVWLVQAAKNCQGSGDRPYSGETIELTLDEFETIRLVDYEKQTHGQCAAQMDISRTTVTEIYERARQKIADCLVNGKRLVIEGGDYRFCDGTASYCCKKICAQEDTENVPGGAQNSREKS